MSAITARPLTAVPITARPLTAMALGVSTSGAAEWTPAALFAAGEQGAWYDPSDLSTMFQDSAGTTPVTAVDQPVGRINDKSGRGNHATQATATKRPMLKDDGTGKKYLLFDGVDDAMSTSTIALASSGLSGFTGVRIDAVGATYKCMFEAGPDSASNSTDGCYGVWAPWDSATKIALNMSNIGVPLRVTADQNSTLNERDVITSKWDFGNLLSVDGALKNYINRVKQTTTTAISRANSIQPDKPIYIGARTATSFNMAMSLFSLILVARLTTTEETSDTEEWVAEKIGVTL